MQMYPHNGFTLIELLVTVAIAAILAGVAVPSYTATLNSTRLATQSNELLGALMVARSEAVRLNQRVILCRSDDGVACSGAMGGWQGWLIFADNNRNDNPDAGEVLRIGAIASKMLTVRASPTILLQSNRIRFGADGFARYAPGSSSVLLQGSLGVCITTLSPALNYRAIRIVAGGRASITSIDYAGACPMPLD